MAFAAVLLSAGPALGAGAPTTARLEVTRGPGAEACLDRRALEGAVQARWGRAVFAAAGPTELLLRVRFERIPGPGYTARLTLHDADGGALGARTLDTRAAHCSALDDSVALAAGLAVDVTPAELSAARAERGAPRSPVSLPPGTAAPRAPWALDLELGGLAQLGLLPGLAPGWLVGLGVALPRGPRLSLRATGLAPLEQLGPRGGARYSALAAELVVCPIQGATGRWRVEGCATERTAEVSARGLDLAAPRSARELHVAAGLAAAGAVRVLGPLEARAAVGVEAPLVRHRFLPAPGAAPLHQVGWAVPTALLALGARL